MPSLLVLCAFILVVCRASPSIRGSLGGRISGGEVAPIGSFPFVAAIHVRTPSQEHFCGGTLLTTQHILTAGHCGYGAILFSISLGSVSLNVPDFNRIHVEADHFIVHPQFNPQTYDNDIGIIQLRLPITLTDYIDTVHFLAADNLPPLIPVEIFGWGQTSAGGVSPVDLLHHVTVTSLSTDDCKRIYGNQITPSMMCVQGNFNEGACIGDSGSPMVQILSSNHVVAVGLHSFLAPDGCGGKYPSGFTRIYPFVDWIRNLTGFK